MKVLILGAHGQVGRALLASAPDDVQIKALSHAECDLGDEQELDSVIRSEAAAIVINAAAYTQVDKAESEPELAERINATAPKIIASAAREAGGRTVHISTDFVFDGHKSTPYLPDDPAAPLGVYGNTKWRGEQAVRAADPQALIVRTAWVYDDRHSNFVATILRLANERDRLTIVDDQVGTPTAASSLASALWTLISKRAVGTYHFTDSGVASWYDFAVAIVEESLAIGLLDREIAIEPIPARQYPTPAARPAFSVLDKAATWDLMGWKAPHWRVGLRNVLTERMMGA